jgi:hypothetical protein
MATQQTIEDSVRCVALHDPTLRHVSFPAKSKPFKDTAGSDVAGINVRLYAVQVQLAESVIEHGAQCLANVSLGPVWPRQR